MEIMGNLRRSHKCGDLRLEDIGKEVTLMGWVSKYRDLGFLFFIDLRDYTGITQVVIRQEDKELFEKARKVKSEYVLAVKGVVNKREAANPDLATGEIEIIANELRILDVAKTPPIYIKDDDNAAENTRLQYRYLDLRKSSMQKVLRTRAEIVKVFRDYLYENNFLEVETPILTKPTPEGARDYLVASRVNVGKFYALPQSPQLFKQMLMVSGVDRYYQIARCFRDEDLRANRQPEFTQVDIEMSFVDIEDVFETNEKLIQRLFKKILDVNIDLPLNRMTYDEAMSRFGSDKPDLRYGFEIQDAKEHVKGIEFDLFKNAIASNLEIKAIVFDNLADKYSRKKIDKLTKYVKGIGADGLIWFKVQDGAFSSSINKFLNEDNIEKLKSGLNIKDGDFACLMIGKKKNINETMGILRTYVAGENLTFDKKDFKMTWVVDFPMFEYNEEEERYQAKHHPFTHPKDEDIEFLESDPERVRAKAYDLVINGEEAGGGSIRINNSDLQNRIFKLLKLTNDQIEEKFGFFVEALQYGTPPHGGIAYGLDRLVMQMTYTNNIKDVIAFPKTQSATCLLTKAPGNVDEKSLEELHLKLR